MIDASPQELKLELGAKLQESRLKVDKSALQIARKANMSQSKVSRIEAGLTTPTVVEVEWILDATNTSNRNRCEIMDLVRSLHSVLSSDLVWENSAPEGRIQTDLDLLSRNASRIHSLGGIVLPGLLQTLDYARESARSTNQVDDAEAELIAEGRVKRQSILEDPTKRFRFLITEAAFRKPYVDRRQMTEQYHLVIAQSKRPNVALGIVPAAMEGELAALRSLFIIDNSIVSMDLMFSVRLSRNRHDITQYQAMFDDAWNTSLKQQRAVAFVEQLIADTYEVLDVRNDVVQTVHADSA